MLFRSAALLLAEVPRICSRLLNTQARILCPMKVGMPQLTRTMEKGKIIKWLKQEGDEIAPGDILCQIQTDKAVNDVEYEEEGVLAKIIQPEGSENKVGEIIAVMAEPGEDWKEVAKNAPAFIASLKKNTNLHLNTIHFLSKERIDDLRAQRNKKRSELATLMRKTNKDLWREDLNELESAIKKYESERAREVENVIEETEKKAAKQAASQSKGRAAATKSAAAMFTKGMRQTQPDPMGRRVEPVVDPEMAKKVEAVVARVAKKKAAAAAATAASVANNEDDFLADLAEEDSQFGGEDPAPLFKRLSATGSDQNSNGGISVPAAPPQCSEI
ncbi:hypothetical protein Aperf_G00000085792 [Anoplocephala perfoliata]